MVIIWTYCGEISRFEAENLDISGKITRKGEGERFYIKRGHEILVWSIVD